MNGGLDDESLLASFHDWLEQSRTVGNELEERDGPRRTEDDVPDVGLIQVVEEFTALRHELKLQTKGSRALQEQCEVLLSGLGQALDQVRAIMPSDTEAAWLAGKALVEALADLDEALDRGLTQFEKMGRALIERPTQSTVAALESLLSRQTFFQRWRLKRYHRLVLEEVRDQEPARRDLVTALLEGYSLIRDRSRRALKAARIEPIACVGHPVDPALMTVLEVVETLDQPPGHVVAEVRRGYTWQGRVIRYAEVRAARAPLPQREMIGEPFPQLESPDPAA